MKSKWRWRYGILALSVSIVVIALLPPVWQLQNGPIKIKRWTRRGEATVLLGPQISGWTSSAEVSHNVLNALVVAEDGRFYEHLGFDWEEILKSLETNWRRGRYVRGASTITQQVVKMAFLSSEKTLSRKLTEIFGAILLEAMLSKADILSWYINLVDFGSGNFGIRAAADYYFQTKPELLTVQEGIHLALVVPSPNSWSKGLRQRRLTDFGHRRFVAILALLRTGGFLTEPIFEAVMATGDFGRPIRGWQMLSDALPEPDESALPWAQ